MAVDFSKNWAQEIGDVSESLDYQTCEIRINWSSETVEAFDYKTGESYLVSKDVNELGLRMIQVGDTDPTFPDLVAEMHDLLGAEDTADVFVQQDEPTGVSVQPLFRAGRNLAPKIEGDGTWAEVRRNLSKRTRNVSSWTKGGGTSLTETSDPRFKAGVAIKEQIGATGSWFVFDNAIPVEAGETLTISFKYADLPEDVTPPTADFGGSTPPPGPTTTGLIDHGDGSFTSWSTRTFDAGGSFNFSGTRATGIGQTFLIGDPLIEKSPVFAPFFDGSTTPETAVGVDQPEDFRWRWLGTPNASESVMEIERVRGLTAVDSIAGVSTKAGKPAVRLISTGGGSAYAIFSIPVGDARTQSTFQATLHLDAPQTNIVSPNARRVGTIDPQYQTEQTPNEAGSYPLRVVSGALTSSYLARLISGTGLGSGDVWWTDIALFAGDFFDYTTWATTEPLFETGLDLWRAERLTYSNAVQYTEPTRVMSWDGVSDAADNTVVGQVVEYAVNTSATEPPTTGWSLTIPSRPAGSYVWMRVVVTYGDGATSNPLLVNIAGDTGDNDAPLVEGDLWVKKIDRSAVVFRFDGQAWLSIPVETVVYSGQARFIPVRAGVWQGGEAQVNATTIRAVRFQLKRGAMPTRIHAGAIITITSAPFNQNLVGRTAKVDDDFQGATTATRTIHAMMDADSEDS